MSKESRFTPHVINLSLRPERGLKKRDMRLHLVTPGAEEFEKQPIKAAFGLGLGNGQWAARTALGHIIKGNALRNVALVAGFPYWKMASAAGLTELAMK